VYRCSKAEQYAQVGIPAIFSTVASTPAVIVQHTHTSINWQRDEMTWPAMQVHMSMQGAVQQALTWCASRLPHSLGCCACGVACDSSNKAAML
jgi:hypothetical protein